MEKPVSSHPRKYRCPVCGKKAVIGTHFCEVKRGPAKLSETIFAAESLKRILSSIIAFLCILALLWGMIGWYSILVSILASIVILSVARVHDRHMRDALDRWRKDLR